MLNRLWIIGIVLFAACSGPSDKQADSEDIISTETIVNTGVSTDSKELEMNSDKTEKEEIVEVAENTPTPKEIKAENDPKPEKPVVVIKEPEPKKVVVVKTAAISFDQSVHKFSRAVEGAVIEHSFTFVNKGDADLLIKNVIVDCGCTTPDYSKDAIGPGKTGQIDVTFDTKGKLGNQSRMITVVTNGDPVSQILRLEGIVDTE